MAHKKDVMPSKPGLPVSSKLVVVIVVITTLILLMVVLYTPIPLRWLSKVAQSQSAASDIYIGHMNGTLASGITIDEVRVYGPLTDEGATEVQTRPLRYQFKGIRIEYRNLIRMLFSQTFHIHELVVKEMAVVFDPEQWLSDPSVRLSQPPLRFRKRSRWNALVIDRVDLKDIEFRNENNTFPIQHFVMKGFRYTNSAVDMGEIMILGDYIQMSLLPVISAAVNGSQVDMYDLRIQGQPHPFMDIERGFTIEGRVHIPHFDQITGTLTGLPDNTAVQWDTPCAANMFGTIQQLMAGQCGDRL
jgi:hypothetical protein